VYLERGWNKNGCPTIQKLKELDLDYDDMIDIIAPYQ
jgi:hypothetical protein